VAVGRFFRQLGHAEGGIGYCNTVTDCSMTSGRGELGPKRPEPTQARTFPFDISVGKSGACHADFAIDARIVTSVRCFGKCPVADTARAKYNFRKGDFT
jgi:hypothetical protein